MTNTPKSPFEPQPGFIIAKHYVPDKVFTTLKESAGFSQISEVLAVGSEYKDDRGNIRKTNVKVGDIILHSYSQHEFSTDFTDYRAVHFSAVLGIMK